MAILRDHNVVLMCHRHPDRGWGGRRSRVVTFANGIEARERIVDIDDTARRIAYTVVDGPFTHHHASFVVASSGDGCTVNG